VTKRVLSTVALWASVFAVIWLFRTTGAVLMLAVLSVLALRELNSLLRNGGHPAFQSMSLAVGALVTLAPWIDSPVADPAVLLGLAALAFSVRILGERTPENRVEALGSTLFGLIYVSLMMQLLVRLVMPASALDLRSEEARLLTAIWFVAVVKFCDVGALLTGSAIGKHKLAPRISPKKTWEGMAGGIALSMLVGAVGAWLLGSRAPSHLTPLVGALIAIPLAAAGVVSDLVKSVIKRKANQKDSGNWIPGIGGVLDLVDSLLLAAPLGYLLLRP
jgi:phosphatidate cytidylyltransferase